MPADPATEDMALDQLLDVLAAELVARYLEELGQDMDLPEGGMATDERR